jgi:limonene-1,2-epoxide hydrolase
MTPEEFVTTFIDGWKLAQPDPWIEHFRSLSHPDVVATQPLIPTARGRDAYMRSFRNTFGLMKDVTVEVKAWGTNGDDVFIESVLGATMGGRRTSINVVDHFTLRDDLIYRRDVYFDPTPILVAVLLRPWVLLRVIRCLRG